MSEHYYAVIMAGGGGTRLWPLSRRSRPKQMLRLIDERSLFQVAVDRLEGLFKPEHILVVTSVEQARVFQADCPQIPAENFIVEPNGRDTAPAIGLSAVALQQRDPQAVMVVLTADHYIAEEGRFRRILAAARQVALDGHLVTLGIHPTRPATGYGYIQQGEQLGVYDGFVAHRVVRFTEKPDQATAEKMLATGDHSWNSGMFVWRVEQVLAEFQRQMPETFAALQQIAGAWGTTEQEAVVQHVWSGIRKISIDYGVMEGAQQVAVMPAEGLGWSDVGSWSSLFELLPTDDEGNIVRCERHLDVDSHNTLVYTTDSERLVVTVGLDDLVIVDTGDVLMICDRDQAQKVRQAVQKMRESELAKYL